MTSRRPLIPAVLAASVALAPAAAAQVPPPTLQFDRTCYTEQQTMAFSGAGYTAAGEVDLLLSRPGAVLGQIETTADANGAIAGEVSAVADQVLGEHEERAERVVTANDRTRIDQGAEPQAQFAAATFTFTRWEGFSPGRLVTGRKSWAEAYGWAFADGRPLYLLFRKGSRTAASVKLGTLAGPCGDRKQRYTVPRKLRPGAYKVFLSTEARRPSARGSWRNVRVARGGGPSRRALASAMDGTSTRMNRVR